MNSAKDRLQAVLLEVMQAGGVAAAIDTVYKVANEIEDKKKKKVSLVASYRIAGITYTKEVTIDEAVSTESEEWMQRLLDVVVADIKQQEKTVMGILSTNVNVKVKRGLNEMPIANVTIIRDWMISEENFQSAKQQLREKYEQIKKL